MSVANLVNVPIVHRRPTYRADGGPATYEVVGTYVARVQPSTGSEAIIYGKDTETRPVNVYLAGRVDVRTGDEFILPDGRILDVLSVAESNLVADHTKAACEYQS